MLLNELAIQIDMLENKYERLEEALDHARTQEQAELIEYRMEEISELLAAAREDYAHQSEYEGLDDYEYNGLSRSEFYEEY